MGKLIKKDEPAEEAVGDPTPDTAPTSEPTGVTVEASEPPEVDLGKIPEVIKDAQDKLAFFEGFDTGQPGTNPFHVINRLKESIATLQRPANAESVLKAIAMVTKIKKDKAFVEIKNLGPLGILGR